MTRDHPDALIDQLLREFLGGDRPRDLTERVLAEARAFDRTRRVWWIQTGAAMAASIAVALTLWTVWPRIFPPKDLPYEVAVVKDGTVTISSGGNTPLRGSRLETTDSTAGIELGGYVNVTMMPSTGMTIGGGKKEEQILLDHGEVQVAVVKKVGTFDVLVGPAKVHVTGTHFDVKVGPESVDAATNHRIKSFIVHVKEGSVLVAGAENPDQVLRDGQEATFMIPGDPLEINRLAGTETRINGPSSIPAVQREKPSVAGPTNAPGVGPNEVIKPLVSIEDKRDESGILQQDHTIYVLERGDGTRILLFPQALPLPDMPPVGTHVHVTWDNGVAKQITTLPPIPAAPAIPGPLNAPNPPNR